MVDTIQFVDSIASSPTVRLDINDGTTWRVTSFAAPPPRLRRAMSSNAMRDGVFVSSSNYDSRVLTLGLSLVHSSADNKATEIQKLARELDRDGNFLRYQPTGATKPVFFRLFRSDMSQLEQFSLPHALAKPTVELLAEPFALGLRETLGPFTVNNDPAAGSNGHYFDVTGVIGDVAAPCILQNATRTVRTGFLSVRQNGTPSDLTAFTQFEGAGCTPFADTTNPGGGPDAAMSGAVANNYLRTSFATTTVLNQRVSWEPTLTAAQNLALQGRFRILAVVRRSDASSVMTASAGVLGLTANAVVTIPAVTTRQVVDLGLVTIGSAANGTTGYTTGNTTFVGLTFNAGRASGTGTLDWDYFALMPADEATVIWASASTAATSSDDLLDGYADRVSRALSGDAAAGTAQVSNVQATAGGGIPDLVPNQTNRFLFLESDGVSGQNIVKANTSSFTLNYWPRYLFVRPSAT